MVFIVLVQIHAIEDVTVLDSRDLLGRYGDVVDAFLLAVLLVGPSGHVGVVDGVNGGEVVVTQVLVKVSSAPVLILGVAAVADVLGEDVACSCIGVDEKGVDSVVVRVGAEVCPEVGALVVGTVAVWCMRHCYRTVQPGCADLDDEEPRVLVEYPAVVVLDVALLALVVDVWLLGVDEQCTA